MLSGDKYRILLRLFRAMPCPCSCRSKKIYSKFRFVTNSAYREATLSAHIFTCNRCIQISTKWLLHAVVTSCFAHDKYSGVIWHLYVNDRNARFLYTNARLPYLRCASVCVLLNMNFRQQWLTLYRARLSTREAFEYERQLRCQTSSVVLRAVRGNRVALSGKSIFPACIECRVLSKSKCTPRILALRLDLVSRNVIVRLYIQFIFEGCI